MQTASCKQLEADIKIKMSASLTKVPNVSLVSTSACSSATLRARGRSAKPLRCSLQHKASELAQSDWRHLSIKHVVESQQFSQESLDLIFSVAREMEGVRPGTEASRQLDGYVMSTLFYEPSTRTRLSFESAMSRLGGSVLSTENAREFSSVAKGETLEGAKPKHTQGQGLL